MRFGPKIGRELKLSRTPEQAGLKGDYDGGSVYSADNHNEGWLDYNREALADYIRFREMDSQNRIPGLTVAADSDLFKYGSMAFDSEGTLADCYERKFGEEFPYKNMGPDEAARKIDDFLEEMKLSALYNGYGTYGACTFDQFVKNGMKLNEEPFSYGNLQDAIHEPFRLETATSYVDYDPKRDSISGMEACRAYEEYALKTYLGYMNGDNIDVGRHSTEPMDFLYGVRNALRGMNNEQLREVAMDTASGADGHMPFDFKDAVKDRKALYGRVESNIQNMRAVYQDMIDHHPEFAGKLPDEKNSLYIRKYCDLVPEAKEPAKVLPRPYTKPKESLSKTNKTFPGEIGKFMAQMESGFVDIEDDTELPF